MKLTAVTVGAIGTNCYIAYDEKAAVVVDPGGSFERIRTALDKIGPSEVTVLLTHGHFDHIGAVNELADTYGAKVYVGEGDLDMAKDAAINLSADFTGRATAVKEALAVKDNQELTFGDMTFRVLFTPGHTPGGVCYYCAAEDVLFAGDTLFCESVGRSDFPGGSAGTLVRSITERLMVLPEGTNVFPGHGEATTIGHEKKYNPFLP